jgi:hypothetical protein
MTTDLVTYLSFDGHCDSWRVRKKRSAGNSCCAFRSPKSYGYRLRGRRLKVSPRMRPRRCRFPSWPRREAPASQPQRIEMPWPRPRSPGLDRTRRHSQSENSAIYAVSNALSGGLGSVRSDEARDWLTGRRNEAIAEATLIISLITMITAIVAAVRR